MFVARDALKLCYSIPAILYRKSGLENGWFFFTIYVVTLCYAFRFSFSFFFHFSTILSWNVFNSIISDTETFRQRHPVTDYDHYEKFVERVAKGEQKVLISEKPLVLAMTSGTSGSSRMLLSTRDTNTEFFLQVTTHIFIRTKFCQHY